MTFRNLTIKILIGQAIKMRKFFSLKLAWDRKTM
ncbi:unknown [Bacteroides sp. CAG:927]|nr:unknown [Bacteroides sp. CAG:927]